MAKCKTFLDANIVITAFGGLPSHRLSAMAVLQDVNRVLLVSDYLRLELIARPAYRSRLSDRMEAARAKAELQFMLEFFAGPLKKFPHHRPLPVSPLTSPAGTASARWTLCISVPRFQRAQMNLLPVTKNYSGCERSKLR